MVPVATGRIALLARRLLLSALFYAAFNCCQTLGAAIYLANGDSGVVERMNLDGTNRQPLFSLGKAGSIGLDLASCHVYWSDPAARKILRSNLDGTQPTNVVDAWTTALAIDTLSGKLYWTTASVYPSGNVYRSNLDGSSVERIVDSYGNDARGLVVHESHVYWASWNDGKILRSNLDGSSPQAILENLLGPVAMAVDPVQGKLYFSNIDRSKYFEGIDIDGEIWRCNLDGTDAEPLVTSGLQAPLGIAVDPISQRVYWTDAVADRIQSSRFDGTAIETIMPLILRNPLGIAIDPAPTPSAVGDANRDGFTGAADYAVWAATFGQTGSGLPADFDRSCSIGLSDYTIWAANFGQGDMSRIVPEPSSVCLVVSGGWLMAILLTISPSMTCRGENRTRVRGSGRSRLNRLSSRA